MNEQQLEKVAEIIFNSAYASWVMNLDLFKNDVFNDLRYPKVGDFVIETSNPFVPKLHAVGKLLEVSEDGWNYKIERLDGIVHSWENCSFVKVADETTLKILRK